MLASKVDFKDKCHQRGTKPQWTKYMLENPAYFIQIMGRDWSPENVQKEAEHQFSMQPCQCCGMLMSRIRCMPE